MKNILFKLCFFLTHDLMSGIMSLSIVKDCMKGCPTCAIQPTFLYW